MGKQVGLGGVTADVSPCSDIDSCLDGGGGGVGSENVGDVDDEDGVDLVKLFDSYPCSLT